VRKTLADANQEEIANLRDLIREYSFITSMQRWRGNRNDPQSVLSEVKTRLSKPILIPKDDAAQMLKDAQSEYDTWKLMPVHNEESGYNGVRSILAPVLSRISLTTYEQRIFSHSPDLYGPVILSEMYSSTPEEQYYLMINLLAKSQRARWALPFLEAHITANGAGPGSKDFREATGAALQILTQDEYNAWYQQMLAVTGSPSTSR
jgi:hypothetical protein